MLARHPTRDRPKGPVILAVIDGLGIGAGDRGDAVAAAHKPTLDFLRGLPSYRTLLAHGTAVGMPTDEDMGNSEVGHNALGAGRVFRQGASLVGDAIESGRMFEGACWQEALAFARTHDEAVHFLGLLSDGNVHSHIEHLLAMLTRCAAEGVPSVRVHLLTDGRDVPGRSALGFVARLEAKLTEIRTAGLDYRVASGGGRMLVTMDRYEADWRIVERGWQTHVLGRARTFPDAHTAIETFYAEDAEVNDQNLPPFVIVDEGGAPVGPIRDGSAVVLFNFRGDRAIEITRAFEEEVFTGFERGARPKVFFAGMMQYDGDLLLPTRFLVDPPVIDRTMGELLAASGMRQLAIAETHKFGHVTYFWNGNRSGAFESSLERYVEVPSGHLRVDHYPWMRAAETTDRLLFELQRGIDGRPFDFVRLNYANPDMVGHTGNLDATRISVEVVDLCLARLVKATRELEGLLVVTADHGNADRMLDGDRVRTSHSLAPVPFVVFDPRLAAMGPQLRSIEGAGLANVAATALELLGFAAPADYAPSLLAP